MNIKDSLLLVCGLVLCLLTGFQVQAGELPRLDADPAWQQQEIARGFTHYHRHFPNLSGGPQVVNVLAISPDSADVRVQLTAADVWGLTRSPIPDIARHAGALAAINGGFAPARRFSEVGYGIMKFDGQVWPFVNDPDFHPAAESIGRNAIGVDASGQWHLKSRGETGAETDARWADDWPEVTDAMAGGSLLLINGRLNPLITQNGARGEYANNDQLKGRVFSRHPRTAMGVTRGNVVLLVTVDGRHEGHATGMRLAELATLLASMGAVNAIEFDGGGSTTMWMADAPGQGVVNHPTDNKAFDHDGARSLRLAVLVMPRTTEESTFNSSVNDNDRQWALPWAGTELAVNWTPRFKGVDHFDFQLELDRPVVGHALRVDTQAAGISFFTTPPYAQPASPQEEVLSQTTTSFLVEHDVEIAINASTFGPVVREENVPQDINGLHISQGNRVSDPLPNRAAFGITADNRPFLIDMGEDSPHAYNALAGFDMLIRDGRVLADTPALNRPVSGVHPRTAYGICEDGRYLYLLVIDGRQPGYSEGASLETLGHLLHMLGAHEGINMDGGGSTTLVVKDEQGRPLTLNRPIHRGEPGTQRPNGNHLGIHAEPLN